MPNIERIISEFGNKQAIIEFVPKTFVPGQNTYNIKYTFTDANGTTEYIEWELIPSTNKIPALRIAGANPDDPDASLGYYMGLLLPSSLLWYANFTIGASPLTDFGISSYSQTASTINTLPVTMMTPYGILIQNFSQALSDEDPIRIEIDSDIPIFMSELNLIEPSPSGSIGEAYSVTSVAEDNTSITNCVSGDMSAMSNAVNYDGQSTADTIPRNKVYFINNRLKKNGVIIETKRNEFQIAPDGRMWLVAPQHSNTGQSYNMTLYMQGTGMTFKHRTPGSPWTVKHLLTPTLSKYYYGEWTDYNNGDFYNTINNTNIPIFADTETGDRYGDGLIDEDMALNAGELENRRSTTGTDLESTDIPNITVGASGIGCNVWALDRGNINSIMSILFDDDQTIIDDIKKGTWLWGNNPADFIISCYFVPFDITNFYDTTTERVYLGFYDTNLDYTRVKESKSSGQRITLVNTTIDSVYGDWRDYTNFKYEIYLPYVGFYPLDVMSYLNKTLTVEMAFDIMTHNIRYYLFANGKIVDRVDGSVGYDIPLMATDQVNKAKSDLAGITNIVKGGIGMVSGGITMGQGYSTAGTLPGGGGANDTLIAQGRAGIIGGAMDAVKGIGQMAQYPKQEIVGNISSSMNIYDINYAYLKITEKDTLKPDQLNTLYNYPSYFMGNVSELSGYTEIVDIRFSCTGTENEINEIFSLLRNGVIL